MGRAEVRLNRALEEGISFLRRNMKRREEKKSCKIIEV